MLEAIFKLKKFFLTVLVGLVVISLGLATYFYFQYSKLKPHKSARQEAAQLIDAVGRLIVLPVGEQPTVATVSDPERLRDQVFFANAKTGDKVLIYALAKKAILYDPEEDKIVEVAPLDLNVNPAAKASSKK